MTEEINIEIDESLTQRMNYGAMIGDVKNLMMDIAVVGIWLRETVDEHKDLTEVDPEELRESMFDAAEFLHEKLHEMLKVVQNNAVILYGEEFKPSEFHTSDCDCDAHDNK